MDESYLVKAAIAAFYELLDTEGRALFGALLGALLVSAARDRLIIVSRRRLSARKQVLLVFLTLGVGYLFEPLLHALAPMLSRGMTCDIFKAPVTTATQCNAPARELSGGIYRGAAHGQCEASLTDIFVKVQAFA